MDELKPFDEKNIKEKTQVVAKVPFQKQQIDSIRLLKGQKLWVYNIQDDTLEIAKTKKYLHVKTGETRSQLIHKEFCVYVAAINRKNAIKKIRKMFGQI